MKKVLSLVAGMGVLFFAGCGGDDGDGTADTAQTGPLDPEQEAILDVLALTSADFGAAAFGAIPGMPTGKNRLSGETITIPETHTPYFNKPITGLSSGSGVINGNSYIKGSGNVVSGPNSASVNFTISGNYLLMLTYNHAGVRGQVVNGRVCDAGTLTGNVTATASAAGSTGHGEVEYIHSYSSEMDFTVNGHPHSFMIRDIFKSTVDSNGSVTTTAHRIGTMDGTSIARDI